MLLRCYMLRVCPSTPGTYALMGWCAAAAVCWGPCLLLLVTCYSYGGCCPNTVMQTYAGAPHCSAIEAAFWHVVHWPQSANPFELMHGCMHGWKHALMHMPHLAQQ